MSGNSEQLPLTEAETPPDRAALADLRARIKAATGPDREIDLALALIHYPESTEETWLTDELGRRYLGRHRKYTASLDAALALVERMRKKPDTAC